MWRKAILWRIRSLTCSTRTMGFFLSGKLSSTPTTRAMLASSFRQELYCLTREGGNESSAVRGDLDILANGAVTIVAVGSTRTGPRYQRQHRGHRSGTGSGTPVGEQRRHNADPRADRGQSAIDAGEPSFHPDAFDPPLEYDQRSEGFPRVLGGRIDIGAFEFPTQQGETTTVVTSSANPSSAVTIWEPQCRWSMASLRARSIRP
jgi:hypothetical protein